VAIKAALYTSKLMVIENAIDNTKTAYNQNELFFFCSTDNIKSQDNLILPIFSNGHLTFTFTCGEGDHKSGHPALRPLHGPSAQPRQTSRSAEPLRSFRKL